MSTRKKASPSKPSAPASAAPSRRAPSAPKTSSMGLDEIKSLIALVGKEPFQEFEFEAGDMKFRIRKDSIHAPAPQVTYSPAQSATPFGSPVNHLMASAQPAPVQAAPLAAALSPVPLDEPGIHYITSPIVGTFYRSSNPSSPSFVNPGDVVRPGQTLCIVEAMKLMNEIESDISGEIIKVLVENGQPVEYGERLFAARVG